MQKLITLQQASEITGISVTSLRRRIACRSLPFTRANSQRGKILFDSDLLQQVLRQEAYSNLKYRDIDIDPEPEIVQTSYLSNLFKPSEDAVDAEAERDTLFGYPPRNTNISGSFTI